MNEYPRRRRLAPDEPPRGGGIPIFPLIIVVIFAGLLLGGLIAHFSQKRDNSVAAASPFPGVTPINGGAPLATVTERPTPKAAVAGPPSPHPTPHASPRASNSAEPLPSPSPKPSHASSLTPVKTPSTRPSVIIVTPPPSRLPENTIAPKSASTPVAAENPKISTNDATGVVRGYLAALTRGDESSAASYLASGLPNETFMTTAARVVTVNTAKNTDGTFKVSADIQTPTGEYFETFTVATGSNGLQIVDHTAIKPQ
ncbi:MAG: hypothetical protein M3N13_00145 [Candidatus Eremiobacteraeota bacterium]|nr:hypothetical protein [Candidatus Eremiobacteraeota bacterium]